MASSSEIHGRQPGSKLIAVTTVAGHGIKHLYGAAFTVIIPEIKLWGLATWRREP